MVPVVGERKLSDAELVLDRSCLLLADVGGEQIADNALRRGYQASVEERHTSLAPARIGRHRSGSGGRLPEAGRPHRERQMGQPRDYRLWTRRDTVPDDGHRTDASRVKIEVQRTSHPGSWS